MKRIQDHQFHTPIGVQEGKAILMRFSSAEVDAMWGEHISHYEWCRCRPAVGISYDDPFYVKGKDETPPF